ncbi:uncharacterized protein LOC134929637 [Pseudophryne corroboree]|uniref:uncharacterized protein LOC134929637 n=1 Tax=Pseudophryne corroboree TaxID=495146 RepID=UPI003081B453
MVLQKLQEHKLYAKLEKCEFEVGEVSFLGYIILPRGFSMDPKKVQVILEWSHPSNIKAIQHFLEFSNYYRHFILSFYTIVAPTVELTKKGVDVQHWSQQAVLAFERLKKAFTSALVFHHPNPSLPFLVEVDASDVGAGAVLSQRDPEDWMSSLVPSSPKNSPQPKGIMMLGIGSSG